MDRGKRFFFCLMAAVVLVSTGSLQTVLAQTAPPMGTAQPFAVLASSTVTNTGATIVTGDVGVSPGSAVIGFPPGVLTGTIHAADSVAAQAQLDARAAFDYLAAEACTADLSGVDLGGLTLTPGVYCFSTSAQLTGTLTLDATGSPNAVFVFKIGSTFTTASNSSVVISGGSACNVYFQVGSSATLGTGTNLLGSIFAEVSITFTTGATATGSSYALTGAVTLDGNEITACMGTLQVCKAAGSGVTEGTPFTFDVAGTPAIVPAGPAPAGSCSVALAAPAGPATITEPLPVGTVLAEVSTLPGAGLLLSSNLGAGTATVSVTPGGQTIATFLNTVPPPPSTGFLQICKIAGSGVVVGADFAFSVNGTPIPGGTVAAGLAPTGTCSAPLEVPAGQTSIAESFPPGTLLTDIRTLPSAGLLVSSDLALGTATVTVDVGGQTIVTFTNAAIVPTSGFLQICKVAGNGVVAGSNYAFSVNGTPIPGGTVPAGPAPSGSCSAAMELPVGEAILAETRPIADALSVLTAVSTSPSSSLVSSDLGARTATVTVTPGLTVATFTNAVIAPATGFLQICKLAGNTSVEGTNFGFSIAGDPPTLITVQAGPPSMGYCGAPLAVAAGPVVITEIPPTNGTVLTAVSASPGGLLVSSDLGARTATVTVNAGGQTIVTFLNTEISTAGFLQICKIAGAGVAVGTNFTFTVAGSPPTVITVAAGLAPGGNCGPALEVPSGLAVVTETETPPTTGTALTSVSTLPSGLLVSSNLAERTATVTVNTGGQTILTFLNAQIPVAPNTGFLQICKIAGAGVDTGTEFSFSVAGIPATIPVFVAAGPAPGGNCSTPLEVPAGQVLIAETPSPGAALAAVSTLPSVGLLVGSDLAAGTATVTVVAGGQTIVTFVNAIIPATGVLQICKIAGAGVAPGGRFTFVVAGASITVLAGGPCVTAATSFPTGTSVTIAEAPSAGTILQAVGVIPEDRQQGAADLNGRTVTVTIGTGVTTVNFTNIAGGLGLLKVCKVAGTGIARGANFSFVAAGAGFTVPAGFCVNRGMLATGTVVTIAEALSSATVASAISVLPEDRQVSVDVPGQAITVTIGTGITEVLFTNVQRP